MAFLDMTDVGYTFEGWPAVVRGVSWGVERGEFHCLVGRSGCGKTTLLKLAAGLLRPDAGRVTIDGRPVERPGNGTALVFQSPTLLDWLTVLDNVLLPVSLHRRPNRAERDDARHLLEQMGLGAHLAHHPRQLSGGQQSRVAIARALIGRPPILLMDEPFAALDALTREELQDALQAICVEHDMSVFFVTHDIAEAVYLADRVAVMDAGLIRTDLRVPLPRPRQPAVRYRADFVSVCAQLREAMDAVQ
jgi:NitT/TauT family transport system ATP-binding protein